jgi:prepilin-type N-terminal cleavage/methylation domain-containing protein
MKREKGFSLLEVMLAIALMGIIAVAFLGAMATGSRAIFIADERATAESLARSQMEYVKNLPYVNEATEYGIDPNLNPTLDGYAISVAVDPLLSPDDGIQKITVTVIHNYNDDKEVLTLDGYKVDR